LSRKTFKLKTIFKITFRERVLVYWENKMNATWVGQTGALVSKTFSADIAASRPYRASILGFVVDDVMQREGIVDINGSETFRGSRYEEDRTIPVEIEIDWGVSSLLQAGFVRTRTKDLGGRWVRNRSIREITLYGSREAVEEFERRLELKNEAHPED
jgi:hypothetical protein